MRVFLLHAHPVETSFNAALHRLIMQRLSAKGHDVDDCDLYAEDFDPRLSRQERLDYHDLDRNVSHVRAHVERLRSANALVMCYPVWNFGFPAILKGYFDRVFLPGVSFVMAGGKAEPSLHNISKVTAVTTYGGDRLRAWLMGDPPRKLIQRHLRVTVRPGAPVKYLAHYDMNRSTGESRRRFMDKVARAMDAF